MRRVGVEARPDLVQVAPQGDSDSGPSEKKDERDGDDDTHKDDNERRETSPSESQISPAQESSESHSIENIENQLLNNAKACYLGNEMLLSTHGETEVLKVVDEILQRYFQMIYLSLMLSMKDAASGHLLSFIPDR